jgi:hypothetical protein
MVAFALGAGSPASATIELVGATEASFSWEPATGAVSGYLVHQRCTGGATVTGTTGSNRATLSGQSCSDFRVQVAAYGAAGPEQPGPLSDLSEEVRLLPAPPPEPDPLPPAPEPDPLPPAPEPDPLPPAPETPESPEPLEPATRLDFDGDGDAEVLLHQAKRGRLERWSVDSGRLTRRVVLPTLSASARVVGNGDHDGDGFADLLAIDGSEAFLWLLHGASPIGGGPLGELGPDDSIEGSGDYDGDGFSDVLVRRPTASRIELWSIDGGDVASVELLGPDPGPRWRVIGSGDHDADGLSDVLWHSAADAKLVRWQMLDRGRYQALSLAAPLAAAWEGVAVGDFDGNGSADVLWRKLDSGELAASFFDTGVLTKTARLEPQSAQPRREVVGSGDYDGDGRTDLLLRLGKTRTLTVWTLNGAQVKSKVEVGELQPGWLPAGVGDESPSTHGW